MPGTPTPDDEIDRRRARVLEAIEEHGGWSSRLLGQLAEEFGVRRETVREYRRHALDRLVAERGLLGKEREAEAFLSKVESYQRAAKRDGAHGPVASMLRIEQTALGIERQPQDAVPVDEADVIKNVAAILADPESLRKVRDALLQAGDLFIVIDGLSED